MSRRAQLQGTASWPIFLGLAVIAGTVALILVFSPTNQQIQTVQANDLVIFVNAATGNDYNRGRSLTAPLQSLTKALAVIGAQSSTNCVVEIVGSLNVGENAVLDFYPAVEKCKNIVIRGQRNYTTRDTVQSITLSGPQSTWLTVHGTLTNLTQDDYQSHFIENVSQQRVYVVRSNSASAVQTIAGSPSTNITSAEITPGVSLFQTRKNAWYVGEEYEMYKLSSTLSFSGSFTISLKQLGVDIRDLHIIGAVNATWINPVTTTPLVSFTGCRFETSTAVTVGDEQPGFVGSMMLNGVFVQGNVDNSQFNTFQNGACVKSESLWINHTTITYMDTCHSFFMLATNVQNDVAIVSSRFYGYGIEIVETNGINGMRIFASNYYIHGLRIYRSTPSTRFLIGFGTSLYLDGGSVGSIHRLQIEHPGTTFGPAVYLENAKLFARYGVSVTSFPTSVSLNNLAEATFFYENVDITRTSPGGPAIQVLSSTLRFHVPTATLTSAGSGILASGQSSVTLGAPYYPAPMTFNTTGVVLFLEHQSRAFAHVQTATNAGAGGMLQMASIPGVLPWQTTDDLAAPGTQQCFFYAQ